MHPSLRNSTPNLCADADIDRVVVQCMHRNTSKERLSLVLKLSNSPVLKKISKNILGVEYHHGRFVRNDPIDPIDSGSAISTLSRRFDRLPVRTSLFVIIISQQASFF